MIVTVYKDMFSYRDDNAITVINEVENVAVSESGTFQLNFKDAVLFVPAGNVMLVSELEDQK